MAKYRKVDPKIWNDEKFSRLSDGGKLCFLFLLTHPHLTPLGAMRATLPGLTAELGWTEKAFRKAFREAFLKGMVKVDENAHFLSLPRFLKYNQPESPNVVKSWGKCLDDIPECALKNELLQNVKGFLEALPKGFKEALPLDFAKAMPNQEQEQEQEQEQNITPPTPPLGGCLRATPQTLPAYTQEFIEFWQAYPKKTGKDAAWKAWQKRNGSRPPIGEIVQAVNQQKTSSSWMREGGRFIPNPATWINQGRWADEVAPATGGQFSEKTQKTIAVMKAWLNKEGED